MTTESTNKGRAPTEADGQGHCALGDWFGSVFPSDREETFVEVFSQEGDPAFVCGLYGRTNGDMIEQIEKDLNANRDFMANGDGRYLYRVTYESAQIGNEGRVELPAYWDLSLVAFLPNSKR
jgi:hypothetical protein